MDTTSLAPHFLQSLRGATQSGKTGHLNRVVRLFSFLFFLNGVGFCTRLNFGGKSFEPLKISLWATLIEADWDGFLLSPPAPSSPQHASATLWRETEVRSRVERWHPRQCCPSCGALGARCGFNHHVLGLGVWSQFSPLEGAFEGSLGNFLLGLNYASSLARLNSCVQTKRKSGAGFPSFSHGETQDDQVLSWCNCFP